MFSNCFQASQPKKAETGIFRSTKVPKTSVNAQIHVPFNRCLQIFGQDPYGATVVAGDYAVGAEMLRLAAYLRGAMEEEPESPAAPPDPEGGSEGDAAEDGYEGDGEENAENRQENKDEENKDA